MASVVFDLDGTLADTSGDLIAAANCCFRDLGAGDMLGDDDAGTAVRGARAMLGLGLTRMGRPDDWAEIERQFPRLIAYYRANIDRHTMFYPGALETVQDLRASGHKVGICTNKPEELAVLLMSSLSALEHFDALIGADTLPVRKPDPAPLKECVRRMGGDLSQACLIGDTVTDHDTARAAGVPSILVTFSPGGPRSVIDLAPDHLLDHFRDLPALIGKIFPRPAG